MKLKALIDKYLNTLDTIPASILSRCNTLSGLLGNKSINKINYQVIVKLKQTLKEQGNSSNTINAKLSMLSTILKYAINSQYLESMPAIPFEKITRDKMEFITVSELLKMLRYCKINNLQQLREILLIGFYTGIRIDNILSITPEDIQDNYIRIWHNKTNKPYSVPISYKLKPILRSFKGFSWNYQQVYYQFRLMKQSLNLAKGITIHTLRHSFCSRLLQKGASITTIQKLANHSNIQTTMIYSHIANKQLEEAITLL